MAEIMYHSNNGAGGAELLLTVDRDLFLSMSTTSGTSDWVVAVIGIDTPNELVPQLIDHLLKHDMLLRSIASDFRRLVTGGMLFGEESFLSNYIFIETSKGSNIWTLMDWCRQEMGLYSILSYESPLGERRPVRLTHRDWKALSDWAFTATESPNGHSELFTPGVGIECVSGAFEGMSGVVKEVRSRETVIVTLRSDSCSLETPPVHMSTNILRAVG